MQCPLEISADHPSFTGHFPKFPVLPGAVLLDETLRRIAHERGLDLTQWYIASAKFLGAVRPGDALSLEYDAPTNGSIRFTVRVAKRNVVNGTLTRLAARDGLP
jgi:3-hydroxymyristoyl/3-hydroxydecanoyl-(acyl carrier protein) dehydratase